MIKYLHESFNCSKISSQKEEKTAILSQILALCNSFDERVSDKVSKKSKDEAILEIESLKNREFSSKLIEVAIGVFKTL